ncbi:glycine cleavage system protein R [Marinibactrum halimedae]|uniref:Glycine cleavage system transcriptional repressor n=1 Tax=Marinibactrum halimedae TaxID=1444977 RepID=A0AA37T9E8_9GAMM|nr:ACT domain-containing protein [Marinibactrum halimedae]MCD9457843.1 hypothetical protein [Marinibactrum halimedae]GLS26336.1 glycine cleavage system protein R [Marinibactrum halimedae]
MRHNLVISLISDDKPGIVEQVACIVEECHGNWHDSHMARWHGKFAGIIAISVAVEHKVSLIEALSGLNDKGIQLQISEGNGTSSSHTSEMGLQLTGPDRPGIVKEVSSALASRGINLLSLTTECGSMPWSGEPLFEAEGHIQPPSNIDLAELDDALDTIADELGIDINLLEVSTPTRDH